MAVQKYAGLIVDVCEGRAAASAASGGDLRSLMNEKNTALTALENMTRAFRLATLERDTQQTLAASYLSRIGDLNLERDAVRLVLSPMPPQTLPERAEELVCQVRGVRSLVRRYEEQEAAQVKSIDATADQDTEPDDLDGADLQAAYDEDAAGEAAPS